MMEDQQLPQQDFFKIVNKAIIFLLQSTAAIGMVLVFWYCSTINYFPSGISIGDTLLFFWVLIAFGSIYSLFVYLLFAFAYIPVWLCFYTFVNFSLQNVNLFSPENKKK